LQDDEQTMLAKLSDATRLLAECRTIKEVQEARDMAEALRHYAKVKGMSTEAANYASELRLRAERKLGGMLAETIQRGRPPLEDNGTDPGTFFGHATLEELGVSKKESSFAQTIASLPEADFESHIAETKAHGEELTAAGLYRLVRDTEKYEARHAQMIAQAQAAPVPAVIVRDNALAFLQRLPPSSMDLLLTDPPYSTEIDDIRLFVREWVSLAISRIKPTGRAYICMGAYPIELQAYLDILLTQPSWTVENVLVWTYRQHPGSPAKTGLQAELAGGVLSPGSRSRRPRLSGDDRAILRSGHQCPRRKAG
jgi:hypothetical protein